MSPQQREQAIFEFQQRQEAERVSRVLQYFQDNNLVRGKNNGSREAVESSAGQHAS